jgi:hypothetical protein
LGQDWISADFISPPCSSARHITTSRSPVQMRGFIEALRLVIGMADIERHAVLEEHPLSIFGRIATIA